jgi:hypothetical protein
VFALTVRLPDELGQALRERAKIDARSVNREIEFLLRQALSPSVDADAYRHMRHTLVVPRAATPRPRA